MSEDLHLGRVHPRGVRLTSVQSNVPDYQDRKDLSMYTNHDKHIGHTFATPKPKSRPLARKDKLGIGLRKQENVPGEAKGDILSDFATPRVTNTKPSSILKKKEHRGVQLPDTKPGIGSLGFSSSRTSDSVPTAHVSPSPLIQAHDTSRHAVIHKYPSAENLRASHGKQPGNLQARMGPDPADIDSQLFQPDTSHRWTSHQNVAPKDGQEEFQVLPHDANVTQDPTYLREAELADGYRKPGGAHVAPAARHSYDASKLNKRDMMQEGSLHQDTNSVHSYNYPSYVREGYRSGQQGARGSSPVLGHSSSSGSDRGFGYSQGRVPGQQIYNPQSYSAASDAYQPYAAPAASQVASSHIVGGDHFVNDFTSWQQKHQEALRRQQFEASQPMFSMAPAPYTHTSHSSASTLLLGDPHKLDAVKRAADNIIKEKDMIIDRQKSKIVDLERHTKESEIDRQRELLRRAQDDGETLGVKLQDMFVEDYLQPQEFEYENAALKAQMAECVTSKRNNQDEIEKKLGASEYEVQQLKLKLDKQILAKNDEMNLITEKMKEKDSLILEWKDKCAEEKLHRDALQKQLDGMERYFDDLPTADEHSKHTEEIRGLRDDKARYRQRVADLEKKVADLQKAQRSRDGLIESLEHNESKLKSRLDKFEVENIRLRERLTQEGVPLDDIEELQYENQRLLSDLAKAKKLLETQHKRQQQIDARHKSELSQLEERLGQEESAITALREEVASKDQNLVKLRQSVKELGGQNQDLMSESMGLQDRLKELERHLAGDMHKLEARLMRELGVCFSELQSLVQICVQHAEGQDPNISALLGVKATAVAEPEPDGDSKDVASLKFKVSKVRDMRNEIDKLRELISNKYAEDMGDNLNCTTQ